MNNLPFYIYAIFGLTALFTLLLFYKATHSSKTFLIIAVAWLITQSIISLSGFYQTTKTTLPRFSLLLIPPVIMIIMLFITRNGKQLIDSVDIKALTLLHTIRIPVELVLFWLYTYKVVPQIMTFEGRNFDILAGISAPIVYYAGFVKQRLNKSIILVWNIVCLLLLSNIIINAVLSFPGTMQQFAFDQPNIALLFFPFVLLPSLVVPLVLLSHLIAIRQIIISKNNVLKTKQQFARL